MTWKTWLSVGLSVVLVVMPVMHDAQKHIRRSAERDAWWAIVRTIRLRHVVAAWVTLPIVLAVGFALQRLPVFGWGWMNLLSSEGGTLNTAAMRAAIDHRMFLLAGIIVLAFGLTMPQTVQWEEKQFRRGSEAIGWGKRLQRCALFGAVHLILGIPIAAGVAIAFAGAAYMAMYLWGVARAAGEDPADVGQRESTALHLVYNWTLVLAMLIALILSALL